MKFATDGHLIEMVELHGVWTPLWMVLEMGDGRLSEHAGHEVERLGAAIPLPGIPERKLLTSGSSGDSGGNFEGDGRAARN